jgi:hypothetical protein
MNNEELLPTDSIEAVCLDSICEVIRQRPFDGEDVIRQFLAYAIKHKELILQATDHGYLKSTEGLTIGKSPKGDLN